MRLALLFIFTAQLQMANFWRIVINEKEKANLITY